MKNMRRYRGFSLTEVLLAVGTLAIGMIFIGGTFLVGIYFTTISTEQTIAAVVADEAFAKIKLYGINLADSSLEVDRLTSFETLNTIDEEEFKYPSTKIVSGKQYYWSALCRKISSDPNDRLVQVTVFINRKVGSRTTYPPDGSTKPLPVEVDFSTVNDNKLQITQQLERAYINGGSTIADNQTGSLYRVLKREAETPNIIVLDRAWAGSISGSVWVVPPPVGGGRYPCIAVYQKVISF